MPRKTKIRIAGEPELCEKIATVIQRFFKIEARQEFEVAIGRDTSHTTLQGKTIYLNVEKANEPC